MNKNFKGIIVEESLEDNRVLNKLDIKEVKITQENNPSERWHMYTVFVSRNEIKELSRNLKPKWYMHFWEGRNIIVIFKDREFKFDYDKKNNWKDAIDYGLSQGIPKEQLDFPIK